NPNQKDFVTLTGPRFIISNWGHVRPDGTFTSLVVPGPNALTVCAEDEGGFAVINAAAELRKLKIDGFPVQPAHAFRSINPTEADPKSRAVEIVLEPSRT